MNNVWKRFTKTNLKLNKKRTIVTIIGIILSVALLSAVSSMFMSSRQSIIDYEVSYKGNFHYAFLNLSKNDIKELELNRKIEEITIVEDIGYSRLEGITNKDKPFICIRATQKETINNMGVRLVEGRLPENDSEILVAEHLETNGGVELKIGNEISLDVGKRISIDGKILNQDNPLQTDEILESIYLKDYTVVGIMKRQSSSLESYSAPGYTVITCFSDSELKENTQYDVYVRYNKDGLKEYLKTTANILNVDEQKFAKMHAIDKSISNMEQNEKNKIMEELQKAKFDFNVNSYLIMIENGIAKDVTMKALGVVVIILFIIIIITSVFCIKNSFEISITEKIKQYGMLASIGATKKQIRNNVYYEAFILAIVGIPLGAIVGNIAGYILMKTANLLLEEYLSFEIIFKFSWLAVILSSILGCITVFLSAKKSAQKASKISPIVAIKNSEDIKIKSKKLKTPWIIKIIFGIGGEISYKNLKRSRKKYRTTVISIAVCVVTFISVYSFMDIANMVLKLEVQTNNFNFAFSYPDVSEEELKKIDNEVRKWNEITDAIRVTTQNLKVNTDQFTEEYKNTKGVLKYDNELSNVNDDIEICMYAIDKESFIQYTNKLDLKYEDVKDKGILLNSPYRYYYDKEKEKNIYKAIEVFSFKEGEKILGNYSYSDTEENLNENINIEIAKITNETPLGISTIYSKVFFIVCIDSMPDTYTKGINADTNCFTNTLDSKKTLQQVENLTEKYKDEYKEYMIVNAEDSVKAVKSLYLLIEILLYGFIFVIALIGITNIFNTVTTNMNLRAKEFASLKSIGMTNKEFRRMIRLESFFYCTKSLFFAIPIGIITSYLLYKIIIRGEILFDYNLPLLAIGISIIVVFTLIYIIMKYSLSKINKQNTIETIRNENI